MSLPQQPLPSPQPLAPAPDLQPLLHDSLVQLSAPSQAWCGANGEMGERPIHGYFHSDTRILSGLALRVGGENPEHLMHAAVDPATLRFVALARGLDDASADPKIRVERVRGVAPGGMSESITLSSALSAEVRTTISLRLHFTADAMQAVKAGMAGSGAMPITVAEDTVHLAAGSLTASVTAGGASVARSETGSVTLDWPVTVPEHGSVRVTWALTVSDAHAVVVAAGGSPEWATASVRSGDSRLGFWVEQALGDLTALRMARSDAPAEVFLAAGAPWFFTLFGRDSIWAARFLLPLGTELAASTLRVLAELQGTRDVAHTAEQPGKIMHELRAAPLAIPGENIMLPPLYYGTVDATALWITLLHDAWQWGMPDAEVAALLPHLDAALAWMRDFGDSDGDGFLEYVDTTGHGLANQGWKDSGDSIQWRDGRLATGPIALCEVQGYAYEAAIGGAELLDRFGRVDAKGRPAGTEWREWAAALKARFAASFWIDDPAGAYPAIALDAGKQRVDTVTSNIGHLLGTGILDQPGSRLVADRLVGAALNSGYGLRTMSTDARGYWPLSYHGGSVWTHDTAIAISGLGRSGFGAEAAALIRGLLAAAEGFDYRMPELHSGDPADEFAAPVPYPAACRPQAWSAGAAVAVLATALGLTPDPRSGTVAISPLPGLGTVTVDGLRFAGHPFGVTTDAEGHVTGTTAPGIDPTSKVL
ncbi:glycogen debranching N-terminal domain-containing protein [Glaciibacter sp. 2TAF33]|uniref:glycogen debranching N-terminal domain-containing protein n=1 Tax=Glaciibacter sp. 2TAF33 TaxID=3233015 RepID=UPI003F91263B